MIPILDSQQMMIPEKGLAAKIPRNAADNGSEGGVGRDFSDILGSHGASMAADADGVADQNPNVEGGKVLLSNGKALPPTPEPGLLPAVPAFDLLPGAESNPLLADTALTPPTTAATADVSRELLFPPAGQDSPVVELGVLVPDEPVSSAAAAAAGQGTAKLPGAEAIVSRTNDPTVTVAVASAAEVIVPGINGAAATVPIASAADDSADMSRAAGVILPVTSGLGDQAKKLVDRNGLSQGSVSEPLNTPDNFSKYRRYTVSPADSQAVKPENAVRVEPRPGGDMNLLPTTANMAKPEAAVERAEAKISQSLELNQYRVFSGAQPALLAEGLNRPAGQSLATGPSFATPVSAGGWGHEFVGRMNLMVKNGVQEMKLQLKPAEMGLLEIKLSTDGDQAKVIFNVHNAAARDAIDLAMPRLRDMLEQSGLQLAHSEVNDQSSQQDQGKASDHLDALTADAGVENEFAEGPQLEVAVRVADSLIDYYI